MDIVRRFTSIFTALVVLFAGVYCACGAAAFARAAEAAPIDVAAAGDHACCRHPDAPDAPAAPVTPHPDEHDCPHCAGTSVATAEAGRSIKAQQPDEPAGSAPLLTLLPLDIAAPALGGAVHPPSVSHPAPPCTLLSLRCALTL